MDSFTTIPTEIIWNISFPCCAMLSLVVLLCPTLYDAMASSPPGSSFHGDSPGKNTGVGCHALLQGINPGIETRSPALQADTLPSTPPGKPMNTGVGSLFLFRGIFPTQNQTRVSCIAGGFFTSWATRKVHTSLIIIHLLQDLYWEYQGCEVK